MFISSTVSIVLEFWSGNHISIKEISKSKVFKNIMFLGEISDNWPNNLFGTNVYKTLEFC